MFSSWKLYRGVEEDDANKCHRNLECHLPCPLSSLMNLMIPVATLGCMSLFWIFDWHNKSSQREKKGEF